MKIFDKIIRPLAIFLVMLSCSCSSFLDTQPQDFISKQNYYKTEAQAYAALNGVYSTLSNIATYANFMVGRMGLDADEGRESSASRILGPTVYNIESTDANIQAHWSILYAGINRANLLLESLDKITMDKTKKDVIKGETLFLRSYFYFMLVSKFGDVPLQLQSSSSKDINSIGSPRVSSVSVYTQITNDMIAAEALLPEITTVGHGGKLSKSAACGILGRVYLHWAGYPIADRSKYMEAEKWLNKVIYTGVHSLNPSYRQVFINYAQDTYDIKESIWEVEFWGDNSTEFQLSGRVGSTFGIPSDDPEKGRVTIFMAPNGWLYKSYAATDTRRDWNIAPFSYTGVPAVTVPYAASNIYARNIAKWRREYEKVANKNTIATPQNYPLLRYADVILMLAETRNEINDGPDAIAYEKINQVRRRARGLPVTQANAQADLPQTYNKATFLAELQLERAKELCFESLRKTDLVRWGIFLERMKFVLQDITVNAPANQAFTKLGFQNASQRDVLWPIPANEITLNPLIKQNPGWF